MTTPDAYAEDLQRDRHLWGDKGPILRERQRRQHEWESRPFYKRLTLLHVGYVAVVLTIITICMIGAAQAFDFQPHEVADRPNIPFEIVIQSRKATTNTCRYILLEADRTACAHIHAGKCFVYVPMVTLRFSWRSQQTALRHEYWHCNGGTHERRGNVIYPTQVSFDPRERIE